MLWSDRQGQEPPAEVQRAQVMLRRAGPLLAVAATALMILVICFRN